MKSIASQSGVLPVRRALVLSPEAPYPMHGGGPLRTVSLIEYLRRDAIVDLIVFRESLPLALPPGTFGDVIELALPFHSKRFVLRAARNGWRYLRGAPPLVDRFSGFDHQIGAWLAGRAYDVAVIEHFWAAPYVHLLKQHARKVICNLHNVESRLMQHIGRPFAAFARRLEQQFLPAFDVVLVASNDDGARISVPSIVYPNAVPERPMPPRAEDFAVAMSGNFDFRPNAEGRRWFERLVWPELAAKFPGLEWRLIGKGANPVEDAVVELARAQVAVVPIFSGSGTRLKILEAWSAGTPVVSTTLGAEGLGAEHGRHIFVADDPKSFAGAVANFLCDSKLCNDIRHSARVYLEDTFTWPRAWNKLDEAGGIY